jgi:hypothetical protein
VATSRCRCPHSDSRCRSLGFAHSYPADSLSIAAIVLCAVFAGCLVYLWLAEAFGAAEAPRSAWGSRLVWYLAPVLSSAIFMPMAAALIAPLSCLVSSQLDVDGHPAAGMLPEGRSAA